MLDLLSDFPAARTAGELLLIVLFAFLARLIVRGVIAKAVAKATSKISAFHPKDDFDKAVHKLSNVVPAIIVYYGISLVSGLPSEIYSIVQNVSFSVVILMFALAASHVVSAIDSIYHRRSEGCTRPIKGYLQVAKLIVYILAAILIVSTLLDKSPLILLSGVGAMAAVLILVFQDTLLSLVASMQIASSNMVRVGDWIEMPHLDANGEIVEISLYTVKVENFDMSVTTVPIRKLITEPMKNYRNMLEGGGRRIMRALLIDQESIRFLTQEDIARLSSVGRLRSYFSAKQREIKEWNAKLQPSSRNPVDMRRLTNIGTFRKYAEEYLRSRNDINDGMFLMVRQLRPAPQGLPLEIYCFTKSTDWATYEQVQSDIFDHFYAILPEFGLRCFQTPSGRNLHELSRTFRAQPDAAAPFGEPAFS